MINATIEVRMTSSRLRGKPLMEVSGLPLIEVLIRRLKQSKYIDNIIVATTTNKEDDPIIKFCEANDLLFFRGSENNVLERVRLAANKFNTDTLVQITGDCPLIDFRLVDEAIETFLEKYPSSRVISNTGPEISMPWGFDVQVYKAKELDTIINSNPTNDDFEHVSQRFYSPEYQEEYNLYHIKYQAPINRPELRVTLDYPEDFNLIKSVIEGLGLERIEETTIEEIIFWLDSNPEIRDASVRRHNE